MYRVGIAAVLIISIGNIIVIILFFIFNILLL